MTDLIIVQTTTGSEEDALRLSDRLLQDKLAACVQIHGPIRSRYWWRGEIDSAQEWVVAAKTLRSAYASVESAIRESHTYDEPEIVATAVELASDGYLQWVRENIADDNTADDGSSADGSSAD